jgi:hypothetical protein
MLQKVNLAGEVNQICEAVKNKRETAQTPS